MFFILMSFLSYLIYKNIYTQKVNIEVENNIQESFISSEAFVGRKDGYVFKNDIQGLGYYIDKIE